MSDTMDIGVVLFVGILVLLAFGLTVAGFALKRPSLALSAMASWFIVCITSYLQEGAIYNALFWISIALTIVSGMEGALIRRGGEDRAEEEVDYRNEMQKAIENRDLTIEAQRVARRSGKYRI
jgi:hypothetical protein